ncbi:MAG: GIY-YIG nuclease family protein [Marinicella pacifica]
MKLVLSINNRTFQFNKYSIIFENENFNDVFSRKNNKTLGETLDHKKYLSLKHKTIDNYKHMVDMPLGKFVQCLKQKGDNFYKNFLNINGDLTYSKFYLMDYTIFYKKGIYLYKKLDEIIYIGRCRDSLKKRINYGYGNITPKNCFKDGQSTNCHLNYKITKNKDSIEFYFHELTDNTEIIEYENKLIKKYRPKWNIQK